MTCVGLTSYRRIKALLWHTERSIQQLLHVCRPHLPAAWQRTELGIVNSRCKSSIIKCDLRAEPHACIACRGRRPVLICGEHGVGKADIAAIIHYSSGPARKMPIVQVDCERVGNPAGLLHGSGARRGLLHWLQGGTLLGSNVHRATPELRQELASVSWLRCHARNASCIACSWLL